WIASAGVPPPFFFVARIEPTGPARSGRPDDRLREIRERRGRAPDFAGAHPGYEFDIARARIAPRERRVVIGPTERSAPVQVQGRQHSAITLPRAAPLAARTMPRWALRGRRCGASLLGRRRTGGEKGDAALDPLLQRRVGAVAFRRDADEAGHHLL